MTSIDLSASGLDNYQWRTGTIAGAPDSPLELARLAASSNSTAAVVLARFPAGWERLNSGFADGAEELFVLQGQLQMSGVELSEGDLALIAPLAVRSQMTTTKGCTALVWFSSPPSWTDRTTPSLDGHGIATTPGIKAHRDEREDIPGSVRVEQSLAGGIADAECDVLAIGSRQWWFVSAGEELPTCAEPVIVRQWS